MSWALVVISAAVWLALSVPTVFFIAYAFFGQFNENKLDKRRKP